MLTKQQYPNVLLYLIIQTILGEIDSYLISNGKPRPDGSAPAQDATKPNILSFHSFKVFCQKCQHAPQPQHHLALKLKTELYLELLHFFKLQLIPFDLPDQQII